MVYRLANYFLHYFFEPVVVPIFLNSVFPNFNLVARLFAQDSIFSSSRYLMYRLSFPTEPSKISPYAKYLLYISLATVYYFLDLLTWFNYPKIYLYYLFTFLTCPIILDNFLEHQIWILETLERTQKQILNYLTCVCLSSTLNHICIHSLHSNPKITSRELDDVMGMQNISYIWTFLKILLITTLIKYLEKSKYVYGRILKILYDRGNLIKVPEYQRSMIMDSQVQNPRETISKIIARRKWHYFYDPTVLNLIITIYQDQEGSLLQEIIGRFRARVLQFFTLWTLHRFIPIPFLAFLFRLRDDYPKNLIIPAVDLGLVLLFPQRVAMISFFSEFCNYLNNGLSHHLIHRVREYTPKLITLLFHQNKYNLYLGLSGPVIYGLNQLNPLTLVVLPLIAKYNFIYLYMLTFGYFSNFDPYHLLTLVSLLYLKINLLDYQNTPIKNTNINLIKSYWSTDKLKEV